MEEKNWGLKEKIGWFFACGKPWHKKWWVRLIGVFLIIGLILTPFAINCAYMKGLTLDKPNTAFSASDLLSFYGAVLTFLGTSVLGLVAYKQTEIHYKSSQDSNTANTLCPYFVIEKVVYKRNVVAEFEKNHFTAIGSKANVIIKNIGQGVACDVTYSTGRFFGRRSSVPVDLDDYISLSIPLNGTFSFDVSVADSYKNWDITIEKEIRYQNVMGYQYRQILSYKLTNDFFGEECENRIIKLYVYNLGKQERIGIKEATTNDKT